MRRMIPIAILLAALPIPGQVPGRTSGTAPLEVTLAYSAMRFNTIPAGCGCSWMPGAKAEFRAAFSRHIGLVGEIAGQHAGARRGRGGALPAGGQAALPRRPGPAG